MAVLPSRISNLEVIRQIGSGGMGAVYLGRDTELNRQVAIKVIREEIHDQEVLDRFFHEARAAAALRHPNIITIYASGQYEHQPYMVMEFIDGESLAEIIRSRRNVSVVDKLSYLEQICAGLHFAHRAGIIHRDVKPANIMVDRDNTVRILDFGIARIEGSALTMSGALIGSVNYMSPEQMLGRPIDHRSDIFSLGSLAYELFCYEQAFKGSLNDGLLQRLPYEHPPSLSQLCPGLPAGIEGVVVRALQKAPEDRFQDLAEMRTVIVDIQQRLESAGDQSTIMILREALQASLGAGDTPPPASPSFEVASAPAPAPAEAPAPPSSAINVFQLLNELAHTPQTPETPHPAAQRRQVEEQPANAGAKRDTPSAKPAELWTAPASIKGSRPPSTMTPRSPSTAGTSRPPSTLTSRPPSTAGTARPPSTLTSRPPTTAFGRQQSSASARRWILMGSGAAALVAAGLAAIPWAIPWFRTVPDPLEQARPGIEAAMERFRAGYRNRDLDAVRAAFPTLPQDVERTMQRTFSECLLYEVTFDQMSVELTATDSSTARADVRSTHTCTPQSAGRQRIAAHHDNYTLRKDGERWIIAGFSPLPAPSADPQR